MKKQSKILKPCRNREHGLFIEHIKAKKYSHSTLFLYSNCLDRFDEYLKNRGINDCVKVTRQVLLDYVKALRGSGFTEVSIEIYFRPISQLFSYLEAQQEIFVNPAAGMRINVPRHLPVVATREEIMKMLNAPDTESPRGVRDRTLMELAYSTGLRRAELIQLDLTDIDMQEASVRVLGKGEKERMLPIGKSAIHWLKEYINKARVELLDESENKALWVKSGGGRINYECVQTIVNLSKEKAGITRKLTCHDFRRAFATHMLQNGAHPVDIQHLLGHASLCHLRKYLQLTIADLKKMHNESRVGQ